MKPFFVKIRESQKINTVWSAGVYFFKAVELLTWYLVQLIHTVISMKLVYTFLHQQLSSDVDGGLTYYM